MPKTLGGGQAHHRLIPSSGLLDGQLLGLFPGLNARQQAAAARAAGTTAAQLVADLRAAVLAATVG